MAVGVFSDLVGQRFWHLVVLARAPGKSPVRWLCVCDCGNLHVAAGAYMRQGKIKRCPSCTVAAKTKHGHAKNGARSKLYAVWVSMHQRCENPDAQNYENYGGRGIAVCERWHAFESFLADMGEAPPRTSLDRIDNNLGYSAENCRWADQKTQMANTRHAHLVTIRGETRPISDWAATLGIPLSTLRYRIHNGMPIQ